MYKSQGAACISPDGGEPENYTFNKGILRGKRQGGTTPRSQSWKCTFKCRFLYMNRRVRYNYRLAAESLKITHLIKGF